MVLALVSTLEGSTASVISGRLKLEDHAYNQRIYFIVFINYIIIK